MKLDDSDNTSEQAKSQPSTPTSTDTKIEYEIRKILSKTIVVREPTVLPKLDWLDETTDQILTLLTSEKNKAREQAFSDVLNKAQELAGKDPDMRGSENLRHYHYFNALHILGDWDGR
jgi:hypothetical protein